MDDQPSDADAEAELVSAVRPPQSPDVEDLWQQWGPEEPMDPADPRARDERWWKIPAVTSLAVVGLAPCNLWLAALAVMATDGCSPDAPCPQGDQLGANFGGSIIGTLGSLLVIWLLPHTNAWRGRRKALAGIALFFWAWPGIWLLLGGPHA